MTNKQILIWIKQELGPSIQKAIDLANQKTPGHTYTQDLLSAMACREVGFLIARYVEAKMPTRDIHPIIKGDYCQRPGEKEKSYHGFGYWQIDIGSYPAFVKSGKWKDPVATCLQAIAVLEEKREYLSDKFPHVKGEALLRASVAAYNCGQGNVRKILAGEKKDANGNVITDIDYYTYNKDYSAEVFRFRDIYNALPD
jgi:hypothetical protein